jgi:Na+-transporting NADH:ubiquinone oxidoreductase subunit NqrF
VSNSRILNKNSIYKKSLIENPVGLEFTFVETERNFVHVWIHRGFILVKSHPPMPLERLYERRIIENWYLSETKKQEHFHSCLFVISCFGQRVIS